jgi:murein DD-endopeptidase MepM/ murein hydrolase activator NlpD
VHSRGFRAHLRLIALPVAFAVAASLAAPASAQESTDESTTTTSSTSTTVAPAQPAAEPTTTTAAPTTTTTVPQGQESAPPPQDGGDGDASSGEDVPTEEVVVPPAAEPATPDPVSLLLREFVGVSVKEANKQLAQAEALRLSAEGNVRGLEATVLTLSGKLDDLRGEQARAVERLQEARLQLKKRAIASYVGTSTAPVEALLEVEDINGFSRWLHFARSVVSADKKREADYVKAKQAVTADLEQTVTELDRAASELSLAQGNLMGADAQLVAKQVQAAAAKGGNVAAAAGFVFPIAGPHSYSDTFGAPRMFGTPYAHLHQGTDIFAASGTPLVACERGVVVRVGTDRLGGTKLWIVGASGTRYYYAHLSGYAPNIAEGLVVNAGDLVGFVGNTGNAISTPAHLHFEVHPNGGPAINPYPLLRAFDQAKTALG